MGRQQRIPGWKKHGFGVVAGKKHRHGFGVVAGKNIGGERMVTPLPKFAKNITHIERSGFLIKSLLQLFKQDINCFGFDLLPAFVNVHGFFKIRHGVR